MQSSVEQQLRRLQQVLHTLGQTDVVDQHILYPGHRREHLMRSLVGRILGGKSFDDLQLGGAALEGLAGDERFAERCRLLLQMLNIQATAEQVRGCSGQQEKDTALVLQIAQLLQAMEQRRGIASRGAAEAAQQQEAVAAARPDAAVSQLLTNACSNLAKLTSDSMQLFAADMSDVLQTYSDQGALQQLQQLRQQTTAKAHQLQEQLKQALARGSSCEGACSEPWQQQVQQVEQGLELLLQQVQQFDQIYQQELSVWAEAANKEGQQQQQHMLLSSVLQAAGSSDNDHVAEGVGLAARRIVAAYKGVNAALEGFGCIMKQHQALQNVPSAVLEEQRAMHSEEAGMYRSSAAILRSAAAGAAAAKQ
ncbi:hypothetical protein COO60DRAFT_1210988 [Scenedesmus sp. NREL 46B-D3]|nr:hypothetical protein COO60DRAFT_1210988 [Scenedesmus sp. NREL 46B-D3]